MASPSKCWERKYTRHSDYGYGLYATQDISRGKTILTEFPETVIHINGLDGQQDLPDDVVLGDGISDLDDFHVSRQQAILNKNPTLLYVPSSQLRPGSPRSANERAGIPEASGDDGKVILVMPSAVNHSCSPNMFRVDTTNLQAKHLQCRFVTTRNVSAGDQLTISYDPRLSKWERPHIRRALLSKEYGFFCRCRKCVSQSGWRDLMPLAPVPADKMRQVIGNYLDSEASMLPLTSNRQIITQGKTVPLENLVDDQSIPLGGARSLIGVTDIPHKEKINLWLVKVSRRTKVWFKNVPGEMKDTLGRKKILVEDPDPSIQIVALNDDRNEDGTLSSKIFGLENTDMNK